MFGLFIDNGPGMGQIDENGPYIDQAKDYAEKIISNAKQNDLFLITPTHGELFHSRPVNKQEALHQLEKLKVENKGAFLASNIKTIIYQLSQDNTSGLIYWLSTGQKTHIRSLAELIPEDENFRKEFSPLQFVKIGDRPSSNTAITGVRPANQIISKGMPFLIDVEVQNFGNDPIYNQYLSLEVEGTSVGEYQVELEAGQSEVFAFEVLPQSSGDLRGIARLEGDTYTFDNKRYFTIAVPEAKNMLLVQDQSQESDYRSYLRPVLEAASQTSAQIQFNTLSVNQIRAENLEDYDAVVLDGLTEIPEFIHDDLQRFVQQGNGLIIFPSENSQLNSYNQFLNQFTVGKFTGLRGDFGRFDYVARFQPLVEGHPILDEIFQKKEEDEIKATMPDVYYYWVYERDNNNRGNSIFQSNLNEPLLIEHKYGDGLLMVSSLGTDPGWSNFPTNPLFAPIYFRMALYAVSFESSGMVEHTLGKPFNWESSFANLNVEIELNDISVKPEAAMTAGGVQIRYDAKDWEPGWADISDGQNQSSIAINQNISESDFSTFTKQELENEISNHLHLIEIVDTYGMNANEKNIKIGSAGFASEIWNWFVGLALVLLLIECLITSKYKAERLS
ncbi:MAG: hypothetical protein WD267_06070 [Balneolales bacterium]